MKIIHINNAYYGGGAASVFRNFFEYSFFLKPENNLVVVTDMSEIPEEFDSAVRILKSWKKTGNPILRFLRYFWYADNAVNLTRILQDFTPDGLIVHGFLGDFSASILKSLIFYKRKNPRAVLVHIAHDYVLACPNSILYNGNRKEICTRCIGKKIKISNIIRPCNHRGFIYTVFKYLRFPLYRKRSERVFDFIVSPSFFLADILKRDGIKEKKLRVIPNPFPLIEYDSNIKKEKRIVFIGRLSQEKNLPLLIETFRVLLKKYPDYKLIIIGDGPERRELEEQNLLDSSILFLGYLKGRELHSQIQMSELLVLPSSCYENFPMSLVEAAQLHTYPIASDIGGMKEVIGLLGIGKVFINNDGNSLLETIVSSLEDKENVNWQEVEKKVSCFSVQEYNKKILDLFHSHCP